MFGYRPGPTQIELLHGPCTRLCFRICKKQFSNDMAQIKYIIIKRCARCHFTVFITVLNSHHREKVFELHLEKPALRLYPCIYSIRISAPPLNTDLRMFSDIVVGGRTGLMVRASDSGSGDPGSILGWVCVFVSLSKRHLPPKSTGYTQE